MPTARGGGHGESDGYQAESCERAHEAEGYVLRPAGPPSGISSSS
jgi:hypothetical protein